MKTLHITIIISAVVLSSIIFSVGVIQSQPGHDSKTYQYEIHEPYAGIDKNSGTVTIRNQTFFVDNLSTFLHGSNATETEWYGIKFSFPHGSELVNTPGGGIFESYVTFPDDPIPYRIALAQGSLPNTLYNFTTVLSTHTNPQVGFTLYNGTIRVLVNWSKVHSDVTINGLNDTYKTGQQIDFQVEVKGFGYFDAGATPDIWIVKQDGTQVWTNLPHAIVLCCPAELEDYDAKFSTARLGTIPVINQTGTYKIIISYDDQKLEKQFSMIPSDSFERFDIVSRNGTDTGFAINYTITGDNKLVDVNADTNSKSLTLLLKTTDNGTLTVSIPRALIDAKLPNGNDDKFFVLVDGQEANFEETNTGTERTLIVPFKQGSNTIEIIGTNPMW